MVLSMGTVGDCYDEAKCEAFFAALECELLGRGKLADRTEARRGVFGHRRWPNRRRHSGLGYLSPMEYETRFQL